MGVVAATIVILAFCALFVCWLHVWAVQSESRAALSAWPHRILGVVVFLFGLMIVDALIVDIPGPFAPGRMNLPAHSPTPVLDIVDMKPVPPSAEPFDSARAQHERLLEAWDPQTASAPALGENRVYTPPEPVQTPEPPPAAPEPVTAPVGGLTI